MYRYRVWLCYCQVRMIARFAAGTLRAANACGRSADISELSSVSSTSQLTAARTPAQTTWLQRRFITSFFIHCCIYTGSDERTQPLALVRIGSCKGKYRSPVINNKLTFYTVWVKKNPPPTVFWNLFPSGWEFLINFYTPIILSFLH